VEVDDVRETVPVRPLRAVTVIVELPELPAKIWLGLTALAAMLKSTMWKTIGPVGWDDPSPVAVTVTV
jgi:hypothetical protein